MMKFSREEDERTGQGIGGGGQGAEEKGNRGRQRNNEPEQSGNGGNSPHGPPLIGPAGEM